MYPRFSRNRRCKVALFSLAYLLSVCAVTTTVSANSESTAVSSPVDIILISASARDTTQPEWVLDGHFSDTSRWAAKSSKGVDPWLQIELSEPIEVRAIKMAFYRGTRRRMMFDVQTSMDGKQWQTVYSGKSSGLTKGLETYKLESTRASTIRIIGRGNTENSWSSLTEIEIPGTDKSAYATPNPPSRPYAAEGKTSGNQNASGSATSSSSSSGNYTTTVSGDFTVSSGKELLAALDSAVAGDVIVLNNGNYGDFKYDRNFNDYVMLRAKQHLGASFGSIDVSGTYGFLHLDGVKAADIRVTAGAHHIKVSRSKFNSTAYFKNASNIYLENNEINAQGATHALILNHIKNFTVSNNYITRAREDLLRITGYSANGLIQNNTLYDAIPDNTPSSSDRCAYSHSDAIQMFGADDTNPTNITIRGNHIYDDPLNNGVRPTYCVGGKQGVRLTMQGIFISDPKSKGYHDILVEENLLYLGTPNSIYINGGTSNVVVRNNTLLPWPGSSGGTIRIVEKSNKSNKGVYVSRNLLSEIRDETTRLSSGMNILKNFVYDTTDESSAEHVSNLFSGAGDGSHWRHFLPAESAKISTDAGYGAMSRLQRLVRMKDAAEPF